jgi:hypothetical protein
MSPDRLVGDAHGPLVIGREGFGRGQSEVGPEPVGVDLVADNPIPDPAVTTVRTAPALCQEPDRSLVPGPALRGDGVEGGQVVWTLGAVSRVQQDPAQLRIGALVIEQDQRDHDASFGQGPNLLIHGGQVSPLKMVGAPFPGDRRIVGVPPRIDELSQIEVEGGMADAQGDGVVHHLDLKPLLGGGLRIGFGVGRAHRRKANPDHRCGDPRPCPQPGMPSR